MCVLEGANACSITGSGCESFSGVRCTGFMDGDCRGRVFFFGALVGGDGGGEETMSGHVQQGRFCWTTHIVKHPHFMFYVVC